ncbi:MAG: hypothetical protein H7318_09700 [Oligoflexus sp.]|nr:hypothetical protein [Oligoflexus sp.]
MIEMNGNIHRMRCVDNAHLHRWDKRVDGNIPRCDLCDSMLRPDVLFFDEFIDRQKLATIHEAVRTCDLLLIVGTPTTIYPAAGYIDIARMRGARVAVVSEDAPDTRQVGLGLFLQGKPADVLPTILIK